jgi:hypothetical protein
MKPSMLKASTAWIAIAALLNPIALSVPGVADDRGDAEPAITLATQTGTAGAAQAHDPRHPSSPALREKIALLRQKVKYVFVLDPKNAPPDMLTSGHSTPDIPKHRLRTRSMRSPTARTGAKARSLLRTMRPMVCMIISRSSSAPMVRMAIPRQEAHVYRLS